LVHLHQKQLQNTLIHEKNGDQKIFNLEKKLSIYFKKVKII